VISPNSSTSSRSARRLRLDALQSRAVAIRRTRNARRLVVGAIRCRGRGNSHAGPVGSTEGDDRTRPLFCPCGRGRLCHLRRRLDAIRSASALAGARHRGPRTDSGAPASRASLGSVATGRPADALDPGSSRGAETPATTCLSLFGPREGLCRVWTIRTAKGEHDDRWPRLRIRPYASRRGSGGDWPSSEPPQRRGRARG
jgi:hypothetical protein